MTEEDPFVLIVEDEPDIADIYAEWLDDEYHVYVAYDGDEAIDRLDETIEVILLDRRMAGLSGDEVLDAVRERELDTQVAMVTAVDPDFDIIEMGFDDYLVKPVVKETLTDAVDDLLRRSRYDSEIQQYYSLVSKQVLLKSNKDRATLKRNDEYQQLVADISRLQDELDETISNFVKHDEFKTLFEDIDTNTTGLNTDSDDIDP